MAAGFGAWARALAWSKLPEVRLDHTNWRASSFALELNRGLVLKGYVL